MTDAPTPTIASLTADLTAERAAWAAALAAPPSNALIGHQWIVYCDGLAVGPAPGGSRGMQAIPLDPPEAGGFVGALYLTRETAERMAAAWVAGAGVHGAVAVRAADVPRLKMAQIDGALALLAVAPLAS